MSRTEPDAGPFEQHEAFDPVELATEAEELELAEERSAEEAEATGEPAPVSPDTSAPADGLLGRVLKSAGSDAAKYLPVRFIPALTSLVTTPLFTRAIDPADYGAFATVSAVCSLLAAFAVNWLQSASIRYYWPQKKAGRIDGFISTVAWVALASLSATAAVSAAAAYFAQGSIDADQLRLIPAAAAYFIAHFYVTALLHVLRAAKRAGAYARIQITVTLLVTGLSVGLVWYAKMGSVGILLGAAIGNAVVAPWVLAVLKKEGSLDPRDFDRPLLAEMASYGFPLVPAAVAGWALIVLDRFVLGSLRGLTEVGLYTVAYTLGDKIMQLVTMPLMLTMMPSLFESYEKHGQDLAEKVQMQFTRYFAILTLPLLAGMAAAAQVFMFVFTGPQYREAYAVLPIVAAGSMLGSFAQVAGAGLGIHKKTTLIMVNTIVAAAVNVGLNYLLIPRFGYTAAAWDTLASYGVLLFATWWQSRAYMRWIIPWSALARISAASLLMGAVLWGMTLWLPHGMLLLLAQLAIGVVLYLALLVLFGGVHPEERVFLGQLGRSAVARLTGKKR